MNASSVGRLLRTAAVLLAAAPLGAAQLPRPFEYRQVHMGLPVRILLYAPTESRAERAAQAAFERIAHLDAVMSDYRDDSELRRLEGAAGVWTPVSPDLLEVLGTSLSVARATHGAFDPTIGPLVALWREARTTGKLPPPADLAAARALVGWKQLEIDRNRGAVRLAQSGMRLDLGGVAKGYILQQALRTLRAQGIGRALIESGGDVVVGSGPPGEAGWRVDAADANSDFRERARELTNAAIATSGADVQFVEIGGVRYSHVIDPRTGLGVTHNVTARVIADEAAIADALATSLSVTGEAGINDVLGAYPDVMISLTIGK